MVCSQRQKTQNVRLLIAKWSTLIEWCIMYFVHQKDRKCFILKFLNYCYNYCTEQKTRNSIRTCPDAAALDKIIHDVSFIYLEQLIPDEFMWQILFILFKVTMFVRMHTFEKKLSKIALTLELGIFMLHFQIHFQVFKVLLSWCITIHYHQKKPFRISGATNSISNVYDHHLLHLMPSCISLLIYYKTE